MDSLPSLLHWAVVQSEAAQRIPPLAIHTAQYARDHSAAPLRSAAIIRARPFTVAFERYVDGEDALAPIILALRDIHSDPTLRLEYEIAWAIVCGGHTDLDVLCGVLGRPQGYETAARRALTLLRDKTVQTVQRRMAETDQRRQTAGAAELARAEDNPKTDTRKSRHKVPA